MEITVRKAEKRDVATLAKIHLDSFEGFFMSKLGINFLKSYYRSCLNTPETICFVAIAENNEVVGFVIGSQIARGYNKKVLLGNVFRMSLAGLEVLFKNPKNLVRLAKNMNKKGDSAEVVDEQNYAEFSLCGVGQHYQNYGIGHQLFNYFEKEAQNRGAKEVSLTTDYYDNVRVVEAYKRWGYEISYTFTAYPERVMYRFIKRL